MTKSHPQPELTLNNYSVEASFESSVMDYIQLMKPRVMSLVIFTGFCGILLAPGVIHPIVALTSVIAMAAGSGAAASINNWYDADIDVLMTRTQSRPTATGKVSPEEALNFGVVLAFLAIVILAISVNITASLLLLVAVLYYLFIYTFWLKRTSTVNILVGGVSGAIPPMIGYSSVTGYIDGYALALFAIIFIWTMPHTYALAIYRMDEYANCKVPMLPVVYGSERTKFEILAYSLLLLPTSLLPYFLGNNSFFYASFAIILSARFIERAYSMLKLENEHLKARARALFLYSIKYLSGVFLFLIIDHYLIY